MKQRRRKGGDFIVKINGPFLLLFESPSTKMNIGYIGYLGEYLHCKAFQKVETGSASFVIKSSFCL